MGSYPAITRFMVRGAAAILALAVTACAPSVDSLVKHSSQPSHRQDKGHPVPLYTYKVVKSWPHHRWSFTEGLVFKDGLLLESSGLPDRSTLLKVMPGSGQVVDQRDLPGEHFGEGITVFRDRVYQLTLGGSGFIYHHNSLRRVGEFTFDGEGWGLTHDDTHLIMSNGTNVLKFLDADTFKAERTIRVTCNHAPVKNLNALQYIKGEIYANIWKTDYLVKINPDNGEVTGWINLHGLLRPEEKNDNPDDVLNGIAYDDQTDRLVVTGKRWPKYFEIRLEETQVARS
jgi:glutamine cyclotransferase